MRTIVFWGLYWGPLIWETTKFTRLNPKPLSLKERSYPLIPDVPCSSTVLHELQTKVRLGGAEKEICGIS